MLFSTAMDVFEALPAKQPPATEFRPISEGTPCQAKQADTGAEMEWVLDEVFDPPRRFQSSSSFPPEATAAVRAAPRQESELLGCLSCGSAVMATGTCGPYLQCKVAETVAEPLGKARPEFGFVLQQLDGLPLFTPAEPGHVHMVDEQFDPAKTFVCAPSFPKTSMAAVRLAPTPDSELVTTLPFGSQVQATASAGTYLQFRLQDACAEGGSKLVWVPRVLGDVVLFVEHKDPNSTDVDQGPSGLTAEAAICEQTDQINRFQQWWADGHGEAAAAGHSILSLVDRSVLQEVVSAGANYHNCLSADRLDGLQRLVTKSRKPGLDALRRALLTKGGAKSQARAVGTVLFKEALAIFTGPKTEKTGPLADDTGNPSVADATMPEQGCVGESQHEVILDEVYLPPRRFVCSAAFPQDATVAVRAVPDSAGDLLTSLPYGSEILAIGSRNSYLQFRLEDEAGSRLVWVPRVLGDLVLFVEQKDPKPTDADQGPSSLSAEAAICEQTNQINRFQQWWADGHGEAAAVGHSILSLVDRSVLQEVVSAGANYHNCLSADRLDGLQRLVTQSRKPGLDALRRALLTKGGAKSQARAVGTVLFKEALAIFTGPKTEKTGPLADDTGNPSVADATMPEQGCVGESQHEVILDEVYLPPRRFVCSDAFPQDATVAVRAVPDSAGDLLTSLPYGSEILAIGSRNSYLQFRLEDEAGSRLVWVPRVLGDLVLFVEQKDPKPMVADQGPSSLSAEAAICEQTNQINRFQQWWADGHGEAAAAGHSILSLVDRSVLQEVVSAGANYHNYLSADRLDGLQRLVDKSRKPGLDALRRALLTKGGAKSQARAVGTVLFKEALAIFTGPKTEKTGPLADDTGNPSVADATMPEQGCVGESQHEFILDEVYLPPRRFVCSDAFPQDATVAVRAVPDSAGDLLTSLPYGSEILAIGSRNSYLQFRLEDEAGSRLVWVPRVLGDLVLFVEQKDPKPMVADQGPSSLSAEAAICEQTNQINRFQQWWADGHGEAAAAGHSILSLVDRSVLQEVVSAGANYHNYLSADRLDGLQRLVDKSRKPGLDALRRALLTKGGAKSQARAVGTVLFKEALAIFTGPKTEKTGPLADDTGNTSVADATMPEQGCVGESQHEVILDEVYHPPRRFVCSDAFPAEATVAVRSGPTQESELLTCLPFGIEPWPDCKSLTMLQEPAFFYNLAT